MKKFLLLFCGHLLALTGVFAQPTLPRSSYPFLGTDNWVQLKNYYLLTALQQDKAAHLLLSGDPELAELTRTIKGRIPASSSACKEVSCYTTPLHFTNEEITRVGSILTRLYQPGNALDKLVRNHIIPSGCYYQFNQLPPSQLLVRAWQQDATSINYTLGVYLEGNKPNYPLIDSIGFNTRAKSYLSLLGSFCTTLAGDVRNTTLFFEPGMQAALLSLQVNERNDPAHYEPMMLTVNKAAVDNVKKVKWSNYPYSVILVPGAGPDILSSPLSAAGLLRCRMAAREYRAGKAPFIIVSGGNVHPYKTPWNEAEEMKKYLLILQIPESAIIMEPHARHTTTNMRNAVRQIFRYGMPFDKPGLVITDKSQTDAIMKMSDRCMKELGYVPYTLGKRLSETQVEFVPRYESMQIDPDEPLDP